MPGRAWRRSTAIAAKPTPPAAPAPAVSPPVVATPLRSAERTGIAPDQARAHRPAGPRRPGSRPSAARTRRRRRGRRAAGCRRRWPARSRRPARPRVQAGQVDAGRCAPAPPPPSATRPPSASSSRAPSALSMPAPPSVLALPPMPRTSCRQPASSAAAITSPEAACWSRSAARDPAGQPDQPDRRRPVRPPPCVPAPRIPVSHRLAGRPVDGRPGPARKPGGHGGVQGAVAAVGDGHGDHLDVRATPSEIPAATRRRDVARRSASP